MINFDEGNLAAGTLITDQFEGINVSTPSEFGVMVFDTNNPTGEDYDLAAEIGNVLIISEDGDTSDPDDDAAGGIINIEFDEPSTIEAIGLLDIEETGGTIEFFDAESNLIDALEIEPVANGLSFELYPGVSRVSYLELELAGSGALTSIDFSSGDSVPVVNPTFTFLTSNGWEEGGQQIGIWTEDDDIVSNFGLGIEVEDGIEVNTLDGDDRIISSVDNQISEVGLNNRGRIITGNGNDLLQGNIVINESDINGYDGILSANPANDRRINIDTGAGDDQVIGTVLAGNSNEHTGINLAIGNIINTGAGNDRIIGSVEAGNSRSHVGINLDIQSGIDTGEENDEITGTVTTGGNGNFNDGISTTITSEISTGEGNDRITGTVEVERNGEGNTGFLNNNFTTTDTGAGEDLITGTVIVSEDGDRNRGFVNGEATTFTGDGDDQIIGTVTVETGSFNAGFFGGLGAVEMGAGDDYLYGAVEVAGAGGDNVGIYNSFSNIIDMGAGDDQIIAIGGDAYTSFGAAPDDRGFIRLGEGNDRIEGFGSNQSVDGGTSLDIAEFEFSLDDSVTFGSSNSNAIDITADDKTMSFTNVEEFVFAGDSFTLEELILLS